jgi:alpha-ketoglutarate-dependent taurine dioxygenase
MSYESIAITPVTPRIGAMVMGVTLAKPLSNRQVEELHLALAEHQVLFFRDQPMDIEAHKRFGRYFGELHVHPQGRPAGVTLLSSEMGHVWRCWLVSNFRQRKRLLSQSVS